MVLTDLFGHPLAAPVSRPQPTRQPRMLSEEARRRKLQRHLEQSNNLTLFEDLFEFLKGPLVPVDLPTQYRSDISHVPVVEEEDDDPDTAVAVPYEAWGPAWIEDNKSLKWSREGLYFLQVRLFWRSFEELALNNNEHDKWSVLKWIFRPAIRKYYVYDQAAGKSHCQEVHERDEPFSFYNCCMAVRMDGEALRDGVRRNVCADLIKAVEKVVSYD